MNEYILNEIIEIIHRVDVKEWKEADRAKICRHIEERMKECNCTEDEILRALKEGRKYNWSTYATFISLRTNHRCKWGVCCGGINFKASVFNYSLFTIEHKNWNHDDDDLDNLYAACWVCNKIKGRLKTTLDQGIIDHLEKKAAKLEQEIKW